MTTPFPEPFDVQWEYTEEAEAAGNTHMYVLPGQRTLGHLDFFRLPAGSYVFTLVVRGRIGGYFEHWLGNTRTRVKRIPLADHNRDRVIGPIYFSSKESLLFRPWMEDSGSVQTTDDMFTLKVVPSPLYKGV